MSSVDQLKARIVKTREQVEMELAEAEARFQARLKRERNKPVFHNRRPTSMGKALSAALGGQK